MEIKIIGSDGYEWNIDEVEAVLIRNKFGESFPFMVEEMKSIELLPPTTETN